AQSSFAKEDHRAFNRQGQAFDRGETFSGVDYDTGLQAVEKLRQLLPKGTSLTQFALKWILMSPAVTCAIPDAKRTSQVDENAGRGVVRAAIADVEPLWEHVGAIQKELISLMGEIATLPQDAERYATDGYARVAPAMTTRLEQHIKEVEAQKLTFRGWAIPGA